MRMDCIACTLDLTLEETSKNTILLIDMASPNGYNKQNEKIGKWLCFELQEWQGGYTAKVISTIIGCLGGRLKEFNNRIS